MTKWKLPPVAKVYEAYSAVGNSRVVLLNSNSAEVTSSSGNKKYLVEWTNDFKRFNSNDNASYWQGYAGYPIIATLMILEKIGYSKDIADQLSGIHWKEINKKFKNKYDKAIEFVLDELEKKGIERQQIISEMEDVLEGFEALELERMPRKRRPPKGK